MDTLELLQAWWGVILGALFAFPALWAAIRVLRWARDVVQGYLMSCIAGELSRLRGNVEHLHEFVEIVFQEKGERELNAQKLVLDVSRTIRADINAFREEFRGEIKGIQGRLRTVEQYGCAARRGKDNGSGACGPEADA